jgi:SAM-dependent methyltransferase
MKHNVPEEILSKRYQTIMRVLERCYPKGMRGMKCLDVGDYYPTLPVYLQNQGTSMTVLDFDCLEETSRIYADLGIEFCSCDLNSVRDNSIGLSDGFDLIIWLEVIEHLKCSPKYVFNEFSRLLKPKGLLVIGTPNAGRLSSRLRSLTGRHPYIGSLEPFYFGSENFIGHRREYFPYEIDQMLHWNGYDIVNRIYFNGSIEDHKKQSLLASAPYLALTYLCKSLRWLYIVIARNSGRKPAVPSGIAMKRV